MSQLLTRVRPDLVVALALCPLLALGCGRGDAGSPASDLREAGRALADENVFDDGAMRERIAHVPLGLVANISAWNYPWFVSCNVVVPAPAPRLMLITLAPLSAA